MRAWGLWIFFKIEIEIIDVNEMMWLKVPNLCDWLYVD